MKPSQKTVEAEFVVVGGGLAGVCAALAAARHGARVVFDSEMTFTGKRMRKLEATTERAEMPKPLARSFRIDARAGGVWRTVFSDPENFLRFRRLSFGSPVEADALRLVVESAWGGGKARVFALDAL